MAYAGQVSLPNVLVLDANLETFFDDNVQSTNSARHRDLGFLLGPGIGFRRQGKQLTVALRYQPEFRLYYNGSDSIDQSLQLDANYQVTSHFALRARGNAFYRRGIFLVPSSDQFMPELGGPGILNQTVFTPRAREFAYNARFDATYQLTRRTSMAVFGGLLKRDFSRDSRVTQGLRNTDGESGGLQYNYRLTPHSSVGIAYVYQELRFESPTRIQVHSALLSYGLQLSRSLTLDLFGGPEYSRLHDRITLAFPLFKIQVDIFRPDWHWAAGGTLIKRSEKTVFQFNAQRQVSDGGGLLGPVTASSFAGSVRRKFSNHWDAIWKAGYARNGSLASGLFSGTLQTETAGMTLERLINEKLTARFGYDFIRQRSNANAPGLANIDRNIVYAGLFYRFDQIPLGR